MCKTSEGLCSHLQFIYIYICLIFVFIKITLNIDFKWDLKTQIYTDNEPHLYKEMSSMRNYKIAKVKSSGCYHEAFYNSNYSLISFHTVMVITYMLWTSAKAH